MTGVAACGVWCVCVWVGRGVCVCVCVCVCLCKGFFTRLPGFPHTCFRFFFVLCAEGGGWRRRCVAELRALVRGDSQQPALLAHKAPACLPPLYTFFFHVFYVIAVGPQAPGSEQMRF